MRSIFDVYHGNVVSVGRRPHPDVPAVIARSRSLPRMPGRRVPEGPPPAPVVQRLRLRYAKRGRLRFSSTRDFQRALERALRRADVPMAFCAGFHPHPRISYANAAPTGTASEAEYVELSVTERVDPEAVRAALDEALPEGSTCSRWSRPARGRSPTGWRPATG